MLLDSNIIIYSTQTKYLKLLDFLSKQKEITVSEISKIEVLGYYKLTEFEKENFELFFDAISTIKLNDEIIIGAIQLRQHKKMSLADAIALYKNIPLLTNNIDDFKHIEKLALISIDDVIGKDGIVEAVIPME